MKKLVYTSLTRKSSWPKEWAEHEEFREHWQELKSILGKDLPGFYLSVEIKKNLIFAIIAVKSADDVYNYRKGYDRLKVDYPVSEFIHIGEYYSSVGG